MNDVFLFFIQKTKWPVATAHLCREFKVVQCPISKKPDMFLIWSLSSLAPYYAPQKNLYAH